LPRDFENARKAREDLFGEQNNRKRYDGYLAGLLDPQIWSQLRAREQRLGDVITRDPRFRSTVSAYDRIKRAFDVLVSLALLCLLSPLLLLAHEAVQPWLLLS